MRLLLFVFIFVLAGCKTNDPQLLLTGNWLWEQTSGGIAGITTKANGSIQINSFSPQGDYKMQAEGKLLAQGTYTYTPTKDALPDHIQGNLRLANVTFFEKDGLTVRFKSDSIEYLVYTLNGTQLVFSDGYADGYTHRYKRVD